MNRRIIIALGVVAAIGVVAVAAFLVWTYLGGGSGEVSGPISAPTLSLEEETPVAAAATPTEAATEAEATAEPTQESAAAPTATASPEAADDPPQAASQRVLFRIVPERSQVRFLIDELLFGAPNTVVGQTDQVAGDIIADLGNPANSQVGEIRINARSLATDNEFRNRALRNQILQSAQDAFEFIRFVPTALEGLPEGVTVGEPFSFQITGDLTIRDITQPVTFEATVTLASETRLEGTATATVQRGAFQLTIPNVPGVADVSEDVGLEIDFVAEAVQE